MAAGFPVQGKGGSPVLRRIVVALFVLLGAALTSTAWPREPAAPRPTRPVTPRPVAASAELDILARRMQEEVSRLERHLARGRVALDAGRDPFASVTSPATIPGPSRTARRMVAPIVAAVPPLPDPEMALVGIIGHRGSAVYSAVVTIGADADKVWFVKRGENLEGGYRVIDVTAQALTVEHSVSGRVRRLVLHQD